MNRYDKGRGYEYTSMGKEPKNYHCGEEVTLVKKKRRGARQGIIANFQFYLDDRSEDVFDGLTVNISPHGFCFLTKARLQAGQTITITRHSAHDYTGQSAQVVWVKNEPSHIEAGAEV